jgi:hypothetical protein
MSNMRDAGGRWLARASSAVGLAITVFSSACGGEQAQGSAPQASVPTSVMTPAAAGSGGAPKPGMSAIAQADQRANSQPSAAGTAAPPTRAESTGGGGMAAAGGGGRAGMSNSAQAGSGQAGMSMSAQAGSSGGGAGMSGAAGSGGMPGGTDITSVCMGGKVGMDSDTAKAKPLNVSREYGAVKYLSQPRNQIVSLQTTMKVPAKPSSKQTLFIWPGLQCQGAADPARIGNGILQPVLTWGSSCAPKAPSDVYANWWMSAMYVNVSSSAAGPSGCAGGDYMDTEVGDLLQIDMSVKGTSWTQTITDLRTMKTVDFTIDLEGQLQNWATWAVEVPSGESIKPVEDTEFTQNVLTFTSPVASCQPSQAGDADYYSAPVLSPDGLHCCFDEIILRAKRN